MSIQQSLSKDHGMEKEINFDLPLYPVDMSHFLFLPQSACDAFGTQFHAHVGTGVHDPTTLVQYALAHWNQYLISNDEHNRDIFLLQAYWLVVHEVRIGDDASG